MNEQVTDISQALKRLTSEMQSMHEAIDALHTENANLRRNVERLQKENRSLRKRLEKHEKPDKNSNRLCWLPVRFSGCIWRMVQASGSSSMSS